MPDTKTTSTQNSDGQPIVKPSTTPQQSTTGGNKTANSNGQPIVKPQQ